MCPRAALDAELRSRLEKHLSHLVRDRDPYLATAGYFFMRDYIRQDLSQWGSVTVQERHTSPLSIQNLILHLPGQRPQAEPILVGAHYDAVLGSPGADDNASGVAVLLELARWLTQHPPVRPVILVAFDLEEYGLQGSYAFVEEWRSHQRSLRLMLSLEMLGYCDRTPGSQRYPPGLARFYPDRGDFIALVGNLTTLPDLIRLSRHINRSGTSCQWLPVPLRGRSVPDTRRSDHVPFWDAGYRAIMVTDTANLRNPHYHQSSDRLPTLDLDFLTGVCQGLSTGLAALY
ncbi:MAG TPA: M28 family peptidase [Candidatus Obscuribacterales bacterium]